jgi:hypothetical protein
MPSQEGAPQNTYQETMQDTLLTIPQETSNVAQDMGKKQELAIIVVTRTTSSPFSTLREEKIMVKGLLQGKI